jgi:hypothetical protein
MAYVGKPMSRKETRARSKRLGRLRNPATLAKNVTEGVCEILGEGRRFHLTEPIDLITRHRGPYCFVGYPPLEIEGYGRDQREALESFADVFCATWDGYVGESNSKLTHDARELKRKLQGLVEAVESAE